MDWILYIMSMSVMFSTFCLGYLAKQHKEEPENRVHFYVARDKSGVLNLYLGKPYRNGGILADGVRLLACDSGLKWYGLNKNDYKDLKWRNEPLEVFVNMEK